jgi:TatD DNase family protein
VQLHAYDGKASKAQPAIEAGYFFSIPTSVVRSRQKQKLARALPLSCILLETDSPVLGPEPGTRNEPGNIPLALHAISQIKGVPEELVRREAYLNSLRLYGHILPGATDQD